MIEVETVFDKLETRCPRLGGDVPFRYCLKAGHDLPCARALVCWENAFPVREYMTHILTGEEWREAFESPPKRRLDTILEAARRATNHG